jgi:hypothetical protein
MFLEVDVEFSPQSNEYYQDAIRIHSQVLYIFQNNFIIYIPYYFLVSSYPFSYVEIINF